MRLSQVALSRRSSQSIAKPGHDDTRHVASDPRAWRHLRTTNVIESSFATVRHRTVRSKGCLSNKTALAMIFKLAEAAERSWRRLNGHNQLPKIILGVRFTDGIEVVRSQAQAAAA
jgi:transposase-like protein